VPYVSRIDLQADPWAGPFRGDHLVLNGDFAELHSDLGISRELYDDIMAWNEAAAAESHAATSEERSRLFAGHFMQKQYLLRRLRAELPPDIEVPEPRSTPPRRLALLRMQRAKGDCQPLWLIDEEPDRKQFWRPLDGLPLVLNERVRRWAEAARRQFGHRPDSDEIRAHQAEGDALTAEVRHELGPDFEVITYWRE
jgi:hypothetical protein